MWSQENQTCLKSWSLLVRISHSRSSVTTRIASSSQRACATCYLPPVLAEGLRDRTAHVCPANSLSKHDIVSSYLIYHNTEWHKLPRQRVCFHFASSVSFTVLFFLNKDLYNKQIFSVPHFRVPLLLFEVAAKTVDCLWLQLRYTEVRYVYYERIV